MDARIAALAAASYPSTSARRVRLGVPECAGVRQSGRVVDSGAVHFGQDVVGGAVDDAGHPHDGVTGQRLGQRADHWNGARHRGFEIQVNVCALGRLSQFAGGLSEQCLVGGHDRLTAFQRAENRLVRGLDRTHQLDDDVDIVPRNQRVDVVGEQLDGHPAVCSHPAHADAAQFQRRTDAGGQVRGALLDDAHHLAADVAQSQHRYAHGFFGSIHACVTSKLNRSSTVSLRRTRRAFPSRTATTAGRPIRL